MLSFEINKIIKVIKVPFRFYNSTNIFLNRHKMKTPKIKTFHKLFNFKILQLARRQNKTKRHTIVSINKMF